MCSSYLFTCHSTSRHFFPKSALALLYICIQVVRYGADEVKSRRVTFFNYSIKSPSIFNVYAHCC